MPFKARSIRLTRDLADHFNERILHSELPAVGFARASPSRWRAEQSIARSFLTYVKFGRDSAGLAFFWGFLSVRSKHGTEHGPFTVRVIYPPQFPECGVVPSVYLMSHRDRWRNGHDSHIESDWRMCLFVPGESGIDFRKPDSMADLLATAVIFLRKEVMYQRDLEQEISGGSKAVWPGEDRAHGMEGLIQAVRARGGLGLSEPCICGSGYEFGICCNRRVGGQIDGKKEINSVPTNDRKLVGVCDLPRRGIGKRPR